MTQCIYCETITTSLVNIHIPHLVNIENLDYTNNNNSLSNKTGSLCAQKLS